VASSQIHRAMAIPCNTSESGAVFPVGSTPACSACAESFSSPAELRVHWKTERHLYNMKHRGCDFQPLSELSWEIKHGMNEKMVKDHVEPPVWSGGNCNKAIQHPRRSAMTEPSAPKDARVAWQSQAEDESQELHSPSECLFDRQQFETVDELVAYMEKVYSFSVPDRENLVDLPGLLKFLRWKISRPFHECIYCNRSFQSLAAVRRHMIDKKHTRVKTDPLGTLWFKWEMNQFYKGTKQSLCKPRDMLVGPVSFLLESEASSSDEVTSECSDELLTCASEDVAELDELIQSIPLQCQEFSSLDLHWSGGLRLPRGMVAGCRERRHAHQRPQGRKSLLSLAPRGGRPPSERLLARQGNFREIEAALARREAVKVEWGGTIAVSKARLKHAPRLCLEATAKVYDGGSKLNNERGEGCRGQGKRHQNAPVHRQPKKNGGRLAKWC